MLSGRDLAFLPSFNAVVRSGSFTAAGRALGLSKSVVSEHVKALEERLGVRLLERTTRRVRLTQVGEQVHAASLAVQQAARDIALAAEDHREAPTGTLRVTAPHDLVTSLVAPICATLARSHPSLRFAILSSDQPRDLVADQIDVALRLGTLREEGVRARRLWTEPEVIVAAGALAERHAGAARPEELAAGPWVAHTQVSLGKSSSFRSDDRAVASVAVAPDAVCDSTAGVRELMLLGAGIAVLPLHAVARDLEAGAALRLCPGWWRRQITLHAVLPARRPPPRVRVFLDHVARRSWRPPAR